MIYLSGAGPPRNCPFASGASHGPACFLEGLPQTFIGFVSDRALSGRVEFGASFVQPDQQKDRKQAETAARRRRNRRDSKKEDIGRGYEIGKGQYLQVEDEEIEKIRIESSHTISIDTFVGQELSIDDRYLEDPYYIAPTDKVGQEAFAVIRDAIRDKAMVALGRVVLSRREHVMMLEAFDKGLLATTVRYSYEVRDQAPYFEDIADLKLPADMKELAAHIVDSKTSHFDPSTFVDHYETALVELLQAKQAGRVTEAPKAEPVPHRVHQSHGCAAGEHRRRPKKKPAAASSKARAGVAASAKRKTGR